MPKHEGEHADESGGPEALIRKMSQMLGVMSFVIVNKTGKYTRSGGVVIALLR